MSVDRSGDGAHKLRRLVAALGETLCKPPGVNAAQVIETHISIVLLAGELAYKFKKPVDLGFLDFSSLAQRRRACEEELRLNRRTARELYLDVVPIGGTVEEPRLGCEPAIEYAVKMRRFPQEDLADQRASCGRLRLDELEAFAVSLARFHASASQAGADQAYGAPAQVLAPAVANLVDLAAAVSDPEERARLLRLRTWSEREGQRLASVFAARKRAGRVRECHGDLHLGNLVFVAGEALPFDGIEFDPALRWIDVQSEVAFLVMDLLSRHEHALAHGFWSAYVEAAGDHDGLEVTPFYLAYRALVRAKIAGIRARQTAEDPATHADAAARLHGHLRLAEALTRERPRALIAMHGLSGSGKSRLAAELVVKCAALRLRSDVERKRLFGLRPEESSRSALGARLYSSEATAATYARLETLADRLLGAGCAVVVDAANLKREERQAFRDLSRRQRVPFAIATCRAPTEVLRQRIAARAIRGVDPSEATLSVLEHQLAVHEELDADESAVAVVFDTDQGEDAQSRALGLLLDRLGIDGAGWPRLEAVSRRTP